MGEEAMKDKLEATYYYKDGTTSSEHDTSKQLHRENGPAVEWTNGDKFWYLDGRSHRPDGPACEYANGDKHWYEHGKRHRVGLPAMEWTNGDRYWYIDGKLHRIDGPAYEHVNGMKLWYIDGKCYDEKDFNKLIEEVKQLPLALKLTDPREWVRKL